MMTELETLQRAKQYMEKLANGINPLDGTVIADDEVVNNVRLSRCFFYVANVLGQVIDNGGVPVPQQKKQKKQAFALPMEKRAEFAFSDVPIPVSEIAKRINALIDQERMSSLSYRVVRDWLMSVGFLEEVPDGADGTLKRTTVEGEKLGILMDAREGTEGVYYVILYDLAAQHFIMDNLDAILDHEKVKKENQGKPWSKEHDDCLVDLYQKGVPVREIAMTLKRNSGGVRARLKKLGLME